MSVKKINLQGREFVQYPELLDAAHQLGLCRITTKLLQIPTAENGMLAIVEAEVVLRGEDGIEEAYTGIGDAHPKNVSRNIEPHLIRMAETRSKARALRDAVNVGYIDDQLLEAESAGGTASEGTGGTPVQPAQPRTQPAQPAPKQGTPAPAAKGAAGPTATQKDINKIGYQMERVGWTDDQGRSYLLNSFGKQSRAQLTTAEVEQMVDHLKKLPACDAWLSKQGAEAGAAS